MEFRCPACDTSYRVPVRIDQQVRCARCNHVWRVAETDFVFADEEGDDSGVPEAFGDPDAYDGRHDEDRGDARSVSAGGFSSYQAGEDLPDQTPAQPGGYSGDHDADDNDIWGWPDAGPEAVSRQAGDQPGEDAPRDQQPGGDAEPDSVDHSDEDTDVSSGARFWNGESEGNAAELSRAQTEIAEEWFKSLVGDAVEGREATHDRTPAAGFERIMEGIEEVIAETGDGPADDDSREKPVVSGSGSADPLSHLVNRDKAQARDDASDSPPHVGGRDSQREDNVVHLTASRAEHRLGRAGETIDSGSSVRLDTGNEEPQAAPTSYPQSPHAVAGDDVGRDEADDETPAAQHHTDDDEAGARHEHAAARFDDFAAPRPESHGQSLHSDPTDDPFEREGGEPDEPDARDLAAQAAAADEAHEAALRDSLAFDTGRHDFEEEGIGRENWSSSYQREENDRDDDLYVMNPQDDGRNGEPQERHDDRTARLTDRVDDDLLLAEYDFGDDDEADQLPGFATGQQAGRSAGRWMVAGAWSLFVALLAGAAIATISFRATITEALPAAAPVYAAVGYPVETPPLVFEDVSYALNGTPPDSLTLKGSVTSTVDGVIEVPRLKITVRDDAGDTVLEDSRFIGQASMVPGQKLTFSIDLDVPPEKLKTIHLAF